MEPHHRTQHGVGFAQEEVKRLITVLVAVMLLISLTGCGQQIRGGTVMNRQYTPTWVQTVPICTGKVCTQSIIVHPESWRLDIWEGDEDDPHGWVSVTEETFDAHPIGSTIIFDTTWEQ